MNPLRNCTTLQNLKTSAFTVLQMFHPGQRMNHTIHSVMTAQTNLKYQQRRRLKYMVFIFNTWHMYKVLILLCLITQLRKKAAYCKTRNRGIPHCVI